MVGVQGLGLLLWLVVAGGGGRGGLFLFSCVLG